MINREIYVKIEETCNRESFKTITSLSDRLISEQYDKELVIRYLVSRNKNLNKVNSNEDIGKYLTAQMLEIINDKDYNLDKDLIDFTETADLLNQQLSNNPFKRNNTDKDGKSEGQFLLSLFESIFVGLSENLEYWNDNNQKLQEKIDNICNNPQYISATIRGKRSILRFKDLTELSRKIFENEN